MEWLIARELTDYMYSSGGRVSDGGDGVPRPDVPMYSIQGTCNTH